MTFFIASVLVLLLGPLFYRATQTSPTLVSAVDGFVFVGIGGLVLVHILPESFERYGLLALFVACIGLFGPLVFEHLLHRLEKEAHLVALFLAIAGLAVHAFADGIILSEGRADAATAFTHRDHLLPLAVVLHRLPEGLTIWWLLRPLYGASRAIAAIAFVAVATGAGFFAGPSFPLVTAEAPFGIFQALMAGALLHVVIHRPHPLIQCCVKTGWKVSASAGAGLAILLLVGLSGEHTFGALTAGTSELGRAFLSLALESAPALLLAYFTAGLVHALLPGAPLSWLKRGSPFGQAWRGVAFGLPLSVCSCGVLPLYRSLILQGVPIPAAMAFLISTPELGLDSFLLSFPLLGVPFTLVRISAAVIIALAIAWVLGRSLRTSPTRLPEPPAVKRADGNLFKRIRLGFQAGFGEMVDHTGPWILLGLSIAAWVEASVGGFEDLHALLRLPAFLEVPLFALLGIPAYVCASGATPLAAVLIGKGVSPGAALAFLLTGPATNITTFGILSQLHGKKAALAFGLCMALLSIALGYSVNFFLPDLPVPAVAPLAAERPSLFNSLALIALAGVFLTSLLRQGPRHFVGQILPSASHNGT